MKLKSFILTAIAIVLAFNASAQEAQKNSTTWIEAGMSYSGSLLTRPADASVSFGVNRQFSNHVSWGILLEGSYQQNTVLGEDPVPNLLHTAMVTLVPNFTFHYPVCKRITWTPRAYLAVGVAFDRINWSDDISYPIELGVQPCSFDIHVNDNCAFNLTVSPLDLKIGGKSFMIQVPFGDVSTPRSLYDKSLLKVGFRWRL